MCLLAIQFRSFADAPVAVAANREESFDRPSLTPAIQPGFPRVACGVDQRAGGTWLGVNEFGLVAAVTNRAKSHLPDQPRSRGLLCRELLDCRTAEAAVTHAQRELAAGRYAGANFVVADAAVGFVIHAGDRLGIAPLTPGLHVITNGDVHDTTDARVNLALRLLDDHRVTAAAQFVEHAARVVAIGPDAPGRPGIVLRGVDRGTVSSSLIAVTTRAGDALYLHAPGPPDREPFADYSHLLREILTPRAEPRP